MTRSMSTKMRCYTLIVLIGTIITGCLAAAGSVDTTTMISESLERKLKETMAGQSVKYTRVNTTGLPYNASTYFNPRGMRQLYNITNTFIDLVQPKQAYPEGMIRLVNGNPVLADPAEEWRMIVTHYGGLAGLAIVGLLLAAVLPCVGLFFCCCRCAGHCGARSEPFDKKHDHCRKVMLSIFLICFTTIFMFGVVCAFVTNEHMQDGTRELPQSVKTTLKDVKLYLSTTKQEIDTLLKINFEELEHALNNILHASGKIVTDQLAESSHAVSLMNLNDIVAGLDKIREDLKLMNDMTRELRLKASQLEILVRKVHGNLLQTLTSCNTQDCRAVMHQYVSNMRVQVEFDKYMDRYYPKLPDTTVTYVLNNISLLIDANIADEVHKGMDEFMKIQREIQQAVNKTIPTVSDSIRTAGKSLADVANDIIKLIDGINRDIDRTYMPKIEYARRHIDQYSPYRYYLGLSISGVLLTVLSCLTFGLFCGVCGKRPDGYGDDCCNKGSGSRFLMMAVWIIFLLTSILMIITVAHMITGVLVERAICEPLKNPKDNRMFKLIDDMVHIKDVLYPNNPKADINMSHILSSCHRNGSVYEVLKVQYIFDLDSLKGYIDRFQINQTIQQLEQKINLSRSYKIISEGAIGKLNGLAESGLDNINFDQYTDNLKDNITTINLDHLARKLRELAATLPNGHEDIKEDLLKNAYDLEGYHRDIVIPMSNISNVLTERAAELQVHIKFNHTSMSDAIHTLIEEVDKAQEFISNSGPSHVKILAAEFGKAFIQQVTGYLTYVMGSLPKVGKCGPISNAYNATLVASCNKILDPFNGFWVSVGWCLILFIPTIVLCVKLSALYQKSDPYPGPLVEAEYLYDAYADRDNVPLAHIHDKKYAAHSRHHHPGSGYPESYDGPGYPHHHDRERIATDAHQSSSHHHDSRYSDLAPKNWDFPNGGPPRYQPAAVAPPLSTEYERPPPYYYPGPGDRN